ncbi:hypothetical protein BM547_31000 [Pseudomonas aeruginosa]|nr:hypothetical protein BM547_31000 [Pseudomonas aeruginosa]
MCSLLEARKKPARLGWALLVDGLQLPFLAFHLARCAGVQNLGPIYYQSELPRLLIFPFTLDDFRAWIVGRFDGFAVGYSTAQQVAG